MQSNGNLATLNGYEPLTAEQRTEFLEHGFVMVRNALSESHRERLEAAVDRVYAEERAAGRVKDNGALHLLGFLTRDEEFADLLTVPTVFPHVWGMAGWNIHTHHNHLDVTPPVPDEEPPNWGWHQDGYRQNSDPETMDPTQPRPMFSLKVGYVLSDLSRTGRGATMVIPGSHLNNTLERPADTSKPQPPPRGAMEVTANPGDAFIFDRRLWHSRSVNTSVVTRKILFVGYTYRWIRPLDHMPIDRTSDWWNNRTPVQKQLLGDSPDAFNYWGVKADGYVDEEIPLRRELRERGLLDRSVPWLR
ncbi:phytanoyl-CoA dioxygenase family protein [Jidongwangia harbinensis]|uniref:phytanoyl-CoA dioxygenase family protein n=1 Tax=Jidongwangia harbinensis TaxID=2878561 RepID=UPI001CD9F483|nr:phytanoyl-CoA dioxygenase family protein [Jidongwangia harbinensis]MCA2216606.1 phytanoyl-CoA dioxygenase family protein [Jidongwangia harbinensis]